MSSAQRLDAWIGKTLFVPLIVRVCQRTGVSQFTVSRVCWFIVFLLSFAFADSWTEKWVFGVFALVACLVAGLSSPDTPEPTWRWFRLVVVATTLLMIPVWVGVGPDHRIASNLLVLIAEYAATIRTIPPLEAKRTVEKRAQEQAA